MDQQKLIANIKKNSIQTIFNTMDYGKIMDNTKLADAWLEELKVIATYKDGHISNGKLFEKKTEDNKILIKVISPLPEDIEAIIDFYTSLDWKSENKVILIDRLADELEKNLTLICQLEILIRGILPKHTKHSVSLLVEHLRYYSSHASKRSENSKGVTVGMLSDDTFLFAFGCILGPALAVGHNVILQAESNISVMAMLIIKLAEKVGFPKNIIGLIPGDINLSTLLTHKNINMISCFGNLYANKYKQAEYSAETRLVAVLKDKSPMIVFNNADLDSASNAVIDAAWGTAGVPCSLNTVIVQEDVYQIFVNKLKNSLLKVRLGSALDKLADISYNICVGNKLVATLDEARMLGIETFYHPPVIFGANLLRNNVIEEDINLPVVTVIAFRNTAEAINLANNTRCGIGASVWTENIGLANEVVRKLQYGNIWVNSFGKFSSLFSIYPYKDSGIGYISGTEGIQEYEPRLLPVSYTTNQIVPTSYTHSLTNGMYKKDFSNAVTASMKGFEIWQKKDIYERFQILKRLANEIDVNKSIISTKTGVKGDLINLWINLTYSALSQFENVGQVTYYKDNEIKSVKEPVGVIVVDENDINTLFFCVIGSLLLGNSVIILNFDKSIVPFYAELCQLLVILKFPFGILNVILDCEDDIFDNLIPYKELKTYICFTRFPKILKFGDLKRICKASSEVSSTDLLLFATKTKNIWSNVGDSIL